MAATTPAEIIDQAVTDAFAATFGDPAAPAASEVIMWALDEKGYEVVPKTHPDHFRREMIRSILGLGLVVGIVAPGGIAIGIGGQMARAGLPSWAYLGWPAFGAVAWMFVWGRMWWAMYVFSAGTERARRIAAKAAVKREAERDEVEAEQARILAERAERRHAEKLRMQAEMIAKAKEFAPNKTEPA